MVVSAMGEVPKLIYIVVVDEGKDGRDGGSFRYTRSVLQSTLQLMGCKPRHSFKISQTVYEIVQRKCPANDSCPDDAGISTSGFRDEGFHKENDFSHADSPNLREVSFYSAQENVETRGSIPFDLYKSQTTAIVARETFLNLVCDTLSEYKYVGPNQRADLVLACRIRERRNQ